MSAVMPDFVAPNEALFDAMVAAHGVLAWMLVALATLHILAAFKHHFIRKDNVLRRMLPGMRLRKTDSSP